MTALDKLKADMKMAIYGETTKGHCCDCKQPFSDKNVHTAAGWRETTISGMCEDCWNKLFSGDKG